MAGSPLLVSKSLLGSFDQLIEVMVLKVPHAHHAPASGLSHPLTAQVGESYSALWFSSQKSFSLKSSLPHFSGGFSSTLYRGSFSCKDEQTSNLPDVIFQLEKQKLMFSNQLISVPMFL